MKFKCVDDFMNHVVKRNPGEHEFHQAVHEVIGSLWDYLHLHPVYLDSNILELSFGSHGEMTAERSTSTGAFV